MRRAAFAMTMDPDGAMADWVDPPDGWTIERVPAELVELIGPDAYGELLADYCAVERPDLLVLHPPYDHLTARAARAIREAGTRLVAYAFDEPIVARRRAPGGAERVRALYDRFVTTDEVPWATAPAPPIARAPIVHDAALVGRAYARRIALVASLREAGLDVAVRGAGWPCELGAGYASRDELRALYAESAAVITTSDWEDEPVRMVKHRLVDTAMLGAFQVAEAAPDLRRYFTDEEVPSYVDARELAELLRAARADGDGCRARASAAREHALAEHTWRVRFPLLIEGLALPGERPAPAERSKLFDQALSALGSVAERDGKLGAARAIYQERLSRGFDASASAGLGRALRALGDPEAALPHLEAAARSEPPVSSASLDLALPLAGYGKGLAAGALPPAVDPLAHRVAALMELGREAEAAQSIDAIADPLLARAVAQAIALDDALDAPALRAALARAAAHLDPKGDAKVP